MTEKRSTYHGFKLVCGKCGYDNGSVLSLEHPTLGPMISVFCPKCKYAVARQREGKGELGWVNADIVVVQDSVPTTTTLQ